MDRDAAVEAREGEVGYGPPSDTAGAGHGTTVATGHHRFVQGDFNILVLSDGFITVPGDVVLPDANAAQRASFLGRLDSVDGAVRSKTNIPVLRRGGEVILVDIGSGPKYQPTDGRLGANLEGAGIEAADVTRVVFTHAHPDHIWATIADDGSLTFPNATYYVGAAEWDYWMGPDDLDGWPDDLRGFAAGARRDLGAVKDRVVLLAPGDEVVPGLAVLDTAGHTPGHLSLEVAGGDELIIAVDVATNEIVSFEHPAWRFGYDMLPDLAIRNRGRLLDRAATDWLKLLGYHWAYPGVGYAARSGDGYRFVSAV